MQAIQTKYIPATKTKPTRIKAYCTRGKLIVSRQSLPDDDSEAHETAAQLLCWRFAEMDAKRYGIDALQDNPWLMGRVSGELQCGEHVHVFLGFGQRVTNRL